MNEPEPALLRRIAIAADLRAGGATWAAVGQRVRRHPESCKRWTRLYRDTWRSLYDDAVREIQDESEAETICSLRVMLRSKSERARREAAHELISLLRSRRTATKAEPELTTPDALEDIAHAFEDFAGGPASSSHGGA